DRPGKIPRGRPRPICIPSKRRARGCKAPSPYRYDNSSAVTRAPCAKMAEHVSPSTSSSGAADHRSALLASYLGWTLDAFDFVLVVMCLTAIGREFHKSDKEMALATVITLAFRPIGALLFGLMADRYGRRLPLMIDLIFYSFVEVLSGLAPNFTTFLILRALFGIGMGGEWGVGASLAMEKVPPRFRGVLSGLLQEGYAVGYLLAALCYFFVFPRYGWRALFFLRRLA